MLKLSKIKAKYVGAVKLSIFDLAKVLVCNPGGNLGLNRARGRKNDLEYFQKKFFFKKNFAPKFIFIICRLWFYCFSHFGPYWGLRLSNFHVIFAKKTFFVINSFFTPPLNRTHRGGPRTHGLFHRQCPCLEYCITTFVSTSRLGVLGCQ